MRKRLFTTLMVCVLTFSLAGCGETTTLNVNVENSGELSSNTLGEQSFVEIGSGLYYDTATRIVYMKNRTYSGWSVYTAYFAPNGLPYRYNPESNTFEEIKLNQ